MLCSSLQTGEKWKKFPCWSNFNVEVSLKVERKGGASKLLSKISRMLTFLVKSWHCQNNDRSFSWACHGNKIESEDEG